MAKTPSSDGASRGCGMRARWLATAQNPTLAAEGRTANQAMANGTLALLLRALAAAGQTAGLSLEHAPRGTAVSNLALGLRGRQADDKLGAVRE